MYVCMYVCNGGRGQLSSEWRHNENGAASAVGAKRFNENDVTMTIADMAIGDMWPRVAPL